MTWAAFFPTVPTSLWQQALTTRGYTGHEQLDEVGLVHMNGRVYDPQLGRFLSADSFVQNPSDLQSLNRYSYVQNNPLSFTDPTGHFLSGLFGALGHFFSNAFHAVAGLIQRALKSTLIRAVIQVAICVASAPNPGICAMASGGLSLASGGTAEQAGQAFTMVFVSAGVWWQAGSFLQDVAPGFLAGTFGLTGAALGYAVQATQVLVHGAVQGALTVTQGGHFLQGFASGAISEAATIGTRGQDIALRVAAVSAAGGLSAQLTGGKFANGAITSAFAFLYNENGPGHGQQADEEEGLSQGRNPNAAAGSYQRPELEMLTKVPVVSQAIDEAWTKSNPYADDVKQRREYGFFILMDPAGNISVQWFPTTTTATFKFIDPGPIPDSAIAIFHTHPNQGWGADYGPSVGPDGKAGGDVGYSNDHSIPGIIQSHIGMFYYGPARGWPIQGW